MFYSISVKITGPREQEGFREAKIYELGLKRGIEVFQQEKSR